MSRQYRLPASPRTEDGKAVFVNGGNKEKFFLTRPHPDYEPAATRLFVRLAFSFRKCIVEQSRRGGTAVFWVRGLSRNIWSGACPGISGPGLEVGVYTPDKGCLSAPGFIPVIDQTGFPASGFLPGPVPRRRYTVASRSNLQSG